MAKYKAYPEYKDSGVEWLGEIPSSWQMWKLSHAYEVIGSGTTPTSNNESLFQGNIPWVTTGELREKIIYDTDRKIKESTVQNFSALKIHPAGSVVIAMYGATIGRLGILGVDSTTNQACCVMTKSKIINNQYLYYWLRAYREDIIRLSSGGGQPNINQEKVSFLKLSAPNLVYQTLIIAFLDCETAKIDNLIEKQQHLIELLKEKRQAVISLAVTKGLNPEAPMKNSEVEWLGQIPEHWSLIQINRLYKRIKLTGRADEELLSVYRDHGVIPKSSRDDNNNKPSDDLSQYQLVKIDDLVLNKMKAWQGSIAISKFKGIVSPAYFVYKPQNFINKVAYSQYIHHLLRNSLYITQYLCRSKGIRINQWDLDPEEFKTIPVLLPPKAEQKEIYETVDYETAKIDTLIEKQLQQIELLKERRAALISAAVTGKIDLRDWTPPASSTEASLTAEEATA